MTSKDIRISRLAQKLKIKDSVNATEDERAASSLLDGFSPVYWSSWDALSQEDEEMPLCEDTNNNFADTVPTIDNRADMQNMSTASFLETIRNRHEEMLASMETQSFQDQDNGFSEELRVPTPTIVVNPSTFNSSCFYIGPGHTRFSRKPVLKVIPCGPKPDHVVPMISQNSFGTPSPADLLAFLRPGHGEELSSKKPIVLPDSISKDTETHKSSSNMNFLESHESNNRKKIEGPCVVCEADGGGFHFGAIVCAACSAFFRRTISEKRKYVCRKEGDEHMKCPIDKRHRCFCRACRLQKCMAMGMDAAAVQPHRDSIGTKSLKRDASDVSKARQDTDVRTSEKSQNLTNLAEQLLAFSRTPIFAPQLPEPPKPAITELPFITKEESDQYSPASDPAIRHALDPTGNLGIQVVHFDPNEFRSSVSPHSSVSDSADRYFPHQNLVEVMVEQYQKLLERRRLIYCPSSIRDILSGTLPTPRPAKYSHGMRRNQVRIEISLFVEFLNSIHPFPKLSLEDKTALTKHLSVSFSILEKYYGTMRAGGLQKNRIIHSDGSYTNLDDPDSIEFEMRNIVGGESMDRDTFIRVFINPLRESLRELSEPMQQIGLTDVEFCGLVGMLLFDPSAPGLDENTARLVKDARDRVCRDWFAYYQHHNISDGIERVGNSMLLMPALQITVAKTAENFQLIRVFELFEYDKILDEIFNSDHDYLG